MNKIKYCILCQTRPCDDTCKSCGTPYCIPCQINAHTLPFKYSLEKDKNGKSIQRTVKCMNCNENTQKSLRIAFGQG